MDRKNNYFETEFFYGKHEELIDKIDELIDKLQAEDEIWSIDSLLNYIDYTYRRNTNKRANRYDNEWLFEDQEYTIFKLGLLTKYQEELFFGIKKGNQYISINSKDYFFTQKEIEDMINKGMISIDCNLGQLKLHIEDMESILKPTYNIAFEKFKFEDSYPERRNKYIDNKNDKINEIKKNKKNKKNLFHNSWEHIIIDGSDHIPIEIVSNVLGESIKYIGLEKKFDLMIEEKYNCLKNIIIRSLERSITKAKTNRGMIAPIFYAKEDDISYLIPLFLMRKEKPDCVLVFDSKFECKTLLSIDEARKDARIFGSTMIYYWLRE